MKKIEQRQSESNFYPQTPCAPASLPERTTAASRLDSRAQRCSREGAGPLGALGLRLPSPAGNGRETKRSHTAISSGGNDSASITASHPLALSTELTTGWAELQGRPPSHFQKERMRQEEEQRRRSKWQGQKREGENRRKERQIQKKGSPCNARRAPPGTFTLSTPVPPLELPAASPRLPSQVVQQQR